VMTGFLTIDGKMAALLNVDALLQVTPGEH
jgi:hypothetical protein